MNAPTTSLQREAVAPLTHIFLSIDLLEAGNLNEDHCAYLAIIRKNAERLQKLIQQQSLM